MTNQNQKFLTFALSFCTFIFTFSVLKRSPKAKAGHYIQVITAYPASGVGGTLIVLHEENRSGKHIIQDS